MNAKTPAENVVVPGVKAKRPGNAQDLHEQRSLGFVSWMPKRIRAHVVAWIGEFVGTFMFLFFAFGVTKVANQTTQSQTGGATASQAPNTSNLLFISLAFGFSLAVNAWVFFRITGGLFNPAVSFLPGAAPPCWIDLCKGHTRNDANRCRTLDSRRHRHDGPICRRHRCGRSGAGCFPGALNVQTAFSRDVRSPWSLYTLFLTAELVFTIFMLAAEKSKATFIAPIGIGLALFIAELSGVYDHEYWAGWLNKLLLNIPGRLLHRRLPESSSFVRARRCRPYLRQSPLDLLGRADPRNFGGRRLLQARQGP